MKRTWWVALLALLVLLVALPVSAAPIGQEGGGIHFGAYTLQAGNRVNGDLVVFGGPVSMGEGSEINGDLTVFGPLTMDTGAVIAGQLVVMGSADIDGRIEGDVFSAGMLNLGESAYIEGDVATAGNLTRAPGAVVEGDVTPVDEGDWDISVPGPFVFPRSWRRTVEIGGTPRWVTAFWNLVRGIAGVVLMTLLAMILASLWPNQLERVGRAVEEAPLTSFGVGLLTLILVSLAAVLLAITICLSPFAFVGMVVVGLGVLLGWVALGLILGQRILTGMFNQAAPKTVTAAIVGTAIASFILALSRPFGLLHTLLLFLLVPPAAGAVLLTRFGSVPYATRGTGGSLLPRTPSGPSTGSSSGGSSPRPSSPRPPAPLPADAEVREPVAAQPRYPESSTVSESPEADAEEDVETARADAVLVHA
ncbi:MAG: polymer-forming cytoskeletal protein [Anaerolineae bacterium]|nr:polymer-forming cytoskeletal protein [Anaerolineae bacterium]